MLLLRLFKQLTVSLDRGSQEWISNLIVVSFHHPQESLSLFQVEYGVFGVANVELELSQVLQGHTKAESPKVLLLFILSAVLLARHQELNQFGHEAESLHSAEIHSLPPNLLRIVIDLRVEILDFGDVSELLGHVLDQNVCTDVGLCKNLKLQGLAHKL